MKEIIIKTGGNIRHSKNALKSPEKEEKSKKLNRFLLEWICIPID